MKRRLKSPQKRVYKAAKSCKPIVSSCANPTIWIGLIGASFLLNVLLAMATLSRHAPMFPKSAHDASGSSFLPFLPKREHLLSSGWTDESEFWRRLYGALNSTNKSVNRYNSTSCKLYMDIDLSTFPTFQQRLREYVQEKQELLQHQEVNSETRRCWLPPPTLCQEQQYSVVVYASPNEKGYVNWRRLFLNILSFRSYPSVADISLLLPIDEGQAPSDPTNSNLVQGNTADAPYVSRLSSWHRQRNVQILTGTNFWELLSKLQPQQASMVWIDGDVVPRNWNGTLLRNTFHQWRQNTRSTVLLYPESLSLHGMFMDRSLLCLVQNHPTLFVQPLRQIEETLQANKAVEWQSTVTALWFLWNVLLPQQKVTFFLRGVKLDFEQATSGGTDQGASDPIFYYHKCLADYFVYQVDNGGSWSRNFSESSSLLCDDPHVDATMRSQPLALQHPFLRKNT